jgi:hypothetical protein
MSNSNQEIIEARLASYIDGDLEPAERMEIEAHLDQNPQYRRLVEELRAGREMLRGLPREAAPAEMSEAFTSQLERSVLLDGGGEEKQRQRMRIGAWPRVFAAAAIVMLTFGLASIVYFVLPGRGRPVAIGPVASPATRPANTKTEEDSEKLAKGGAGEEGAGARNDEDARKGGTTVNEPQRLAAAAGGVAEVERSKVSMGKLGEGQDGVAGKSLGAAGPGALGAKAEAEQRMGELEQLARTAAADPNVIELLDEKPVARRANFEGTVSGNALVIVVRSNHSQEVEKALLAWCVERKIQVQPAPPRMELALNNATRQQSEQLARKQDTGYADAKATGMDRGLQEQKKTAESVAGGKGRGQGGAAAPHAAMPAKPAAAFGQKAKPGAADHPLAKAAPAPVASDPAAALAPAAPAAPAPAPPAAPATAATPIPSPAPPVAPAAVAPPAAAQVAHVAAQPAPAGPITREAGAADLSKRSLEKDAANLRSEAPIEHVYVARRLSRGEAQGLNACLALNGEVRQSDIVRPFNDKEAGDKASKGAFNFARDNPTGANNAAAAPPPALAALSGRGDGRPHEILAKVATQPAILSADASAVPPAAPAVIVQKGDELRVQYGTDKEGKEVSETIKVLDDGTVKPQASVYANRKALQAAGKTLNELAQSLQPTAEEKAAEPAAATAAPVKVSIVPGDDDQARVDAAKPASGVPTTLAAVDALKDDRQRQAMTSSALADNLAASRPSTASADMVDVVILVQRDETPALNQAAPLPPAAQPREVKSAPSTAPAMQPAPAATPEPAK